jgi:hypothetical protein
MKACAIWRHAKACAIWRHVPYEGMCHMKACAIWRHVPYEGMCHMKACAIWRHVPYEGMCHMKACAIWKHVPYEDMPRHVPYEDMPRHVPYEGMCHMNNSVFRISFQLNKPILWVKIGTFSNTFPNLQHSVLLVSATLEDCNSVPHSLAWYVVSFLLLSRGQSFRIFSGVTKVHNRRQQTELQRPSLQVAAVLFSLHLVDIISFGVVSIVGHCPLGV